MLKLYYNSSRSSSSNKTSNAEPRDVKTRRWSVETRKLQVTARDEQDVARMMMHRWPDYEIEIKQILGPTEGGAKWYEVTLMKRDKSKDE